MLGGIVWGLHAAQMVTMLVIGLEKRILVAEQPRLP